MEKQTENPKTIKFAEFIPTIFCLIIAIFLQFIIFATSPKIEGSFLPQLYLALESVLIEYIALGFLLLILNSFIFKFNKRENLISLGIFSIVEWLIFIIWFIIYVNK